MKGLVFREFLNMVESEFGDEMTDLIINEANIPNEGAYTSVGTYDHKELIDLVTRLSIHTNIESSELFKRFGQQSFKVFEKSYISYFENISDSFSFLSLVENTIHVNVLKLYPEAELPRIEVNQADNSQMILTYHSKRKMGSFAEGLITGCMDHFNEEADIKKTNLVEDGSVVEFTITKK